MLPLIIRSTEETMKVLPETLKAAAHMESMERMQRYLLL